MEKLLLGKTGAFHQENSPQKNFLLAEFSHSEWSSLPKIAI
jgi:hypothetical protein